MWLKNVNSISRIDISTLGIIYVCITTAYITVTHNKLYYFKLFEVEKFHRLIGNHKNILVK